MRASLSINELRTYSDPVTALLLAAFQYITHSEISADLLYVNAFALVSERGAAGDYKAMANTGEAGGQLLCNDIRQIVLRWIAAQIGEGQNDQRQARSCVPPPRISHRVIDEPDGDRKHGGRETACGIPDLGAKTAQAWRR